MTPPVQPVPAADQSQQVTDLLNRIFNSSNWRGEVEKTVKKNTRLQQLVRDQKAQLDKFAAKFNLDTDDLVRRATADAERRIGGKGGKSGVRVPATRSARSDNAGTKDSKKLADLEKDSRANPLYSSI
jgi:hypothetical protein